MSSTYERFLVRDDTTYTNGRNRKKVDIYKSTYLYDKERRAEVFYNNPSHGY